MLSKCVRVYEKRLIILWRGGRKINKNKKTLQYFAMSFSL